MALVKLRSEDPEFKSPLRSEGHWVTMIAVQSNLIQLLQQSGGLGGVGISCMPL